MAPSEQIAIAADGCQLHLEQHEAAGPARGALIMMHGFGVHSGPYRPVAAALAQAGLAVTAFDCRGHGQSQGRRGYVNSFRQFRDDLQLVIEAVKAAHPGMPLGLLGHSHGATIALDYALAPDHSPIQALVLVCPYLALKMRVPAWKTSLARVVGRVWPTLALGNGVRSEDSTRDPEVRQRLSGDRLAHHVATPRWFNEVRAAQTHILSQGSTLRVPTFMALAGDDRIVQTEAALAFARDAGSIVEVKVYDGAYHELFLEPDWRRIADDCASWVVARLGAPYT